MLAETVYFKRNAAFPEANESASGEPMTHARP
jgi:hypothetical protein